MQHTDREVVGRAICAIMRRYASYQIEHIGADNRSATGSSTIKPGVLQGMLGHMERMALAPEDAALRSTAEALLASIAGLGAPAVVLHGGTSWRRGVELQPWRAAFEVMGKRAGLVTLANSIAESIRRGNSPLVPKARAEHELRAGIRKEIAAWAYGERDLAWRLSRRVPIGDSTVEVRPRYE